MAGEGEDGMIPLGHLLDRAWTSPDPRAEPSSMRLCLALERGVTLPSRNCVVHTFYSPFNATLLRLMRLMPG